MSDAAIEPASGLAAFVASRGAALTANFEVFRLLAARAESRERAGACTEAAAWAQAAANFASRNHGGLFASPSLERTLARIGRAALANAAPDSRHAEAERRGGRRRLLHIVTRTYAIGGHTRLLERWMRLDSASVHSLLVTQQDRGDLSKAVLAACEASGGTVRFLAEESRGGLVRAATLVRSLADQADFVVSHAHPWDVVPVLALENRRSQAPAILLNHADHVFWTGTSAFDLIACLRDSGAALCLARRGLPAQRIARLPIPLDPPGTRPPRGAAKADLVAELGLDAHATLILTVGQPYKYEPVAGIDLFGALAAVLASRPSAVLVAVGPRDTGIWAEAARRTNGRVRALGPRRDIARFYEAADVYLDSAPFASLTALLEAGTHGTPVVSFQPQSDAAIIFSDDPGLAGVYVVAGTSEGLTRELGLLLDDPALREALGEKTRVSIERAHSTEVWRASLEALYTRASQSRSTRDDSLPAGEDLPLHESVDALLYELHRVSGMDVKLARVLKRAAESMPLVARWSLQSKLRLRSLARFGRQREEGVTSLDRKLFLG